MRLRWAEGRLSSLSTSKNVHTRRHLEIVQRTRQQRPCVPCKVRAPEALQQGTTLIFSEATPTAHGCLVKRRPVSILRQASACRLFSLTQDLCVLSRPCGTPVRPNPTSAVRRAGLACVTDTTAAIPVHANSQLPKISPLFIFFHERGIERAQPLSCLKLTACSRTNGLQYSLFVLNVLFPSTILRSRQVLSRSVSLMEA